MPIERDHLPSLYRSVPESVAMSPENPTLIQQIEARVRESTHGRIRNLTVEEVKGLVVVRGQAPSHHTRQLALQGALELLSGDRFSSMITVG
jgi:hypothetical protein